MAIRILYNITFYTFSPVVTKIALGEALGGPMETHGPARRPWVAHGDPCPPPETHGGPLGTHFVGPWVLTDLCVLQLACNMLANP